MTATDAARDPRADALRGHAAMLVFSAVVAGSFSLGAMVANQIDPAALNAVRFLIAALVLGLLVQVLPGRNGRGFRRADLASPWRYVILAALFAGYFVAMFEGLKTAHPVSAGAVFTLTPLMTAGFAWLLLRQRMDGWLAAALSIGGAGAVWVIFRADLAALMAFEIGRGEAVYFTGCVLHAVFTPLLRRWNRGESALVVTSLVMAAGFVLLALYSWPELRAIRWSALSPLIWIAIFYLSLVASALSFVLLQFAAQRLPSSKVMAYTYLTPVWIILIELSLGNGGPSPAVLPGVALIVAALVMLLRRD